MEFSKEFIEAQKLDENQVKAITGFVANEYIPNLKKEWDGKANTDAEGIISGAAKYAATKFGVTMEREQGEKLGDYLQRISDAGFSTKETALRQKEAQLEEKLKNFKGSDEIKQQLEAEKAKNDALLRQVAELEPLKGLDEKYKGATEELSGLKLSVAFDRVRPNFPDTVNKYEADAKWNAFKKSVLEKYNIELVDNEPVAIDKENIHKQIKLSALLEQDGDIKELLAGRQQRGTGADPVGFKDVEGVPFKVPSKATTEERSKLIREYLVGKGIPITSEEFSKQFSELNLKIAKSA